MWHTVLFLQLTHLLLGIDFKSYSYVKLGKSMHHSREFFTTQLRFCHTQFIKMPHKAFGFRFKVQITFPCLYISQVIWQFIVGMLTNLESLPLDRIHSMLKMFAMQGPGSEYSIPELKAFLDKKVKEQKLLCESGVYRLTKNG